jgi:hypothetical protein
VVALPPLPEEPINQHEDAVVHCFPDYLQRLELLEAKGAVEVAEFSPNDVEEDFAEHLVQKVDFERFYVGLEVQVGQVQGRGVEVPHDVLQIRCRDDEELEILKLLQEEVFVDVGTLEGTCS